MDWVAQIFIFGSLALLFFLLSLVCAGLKRFRTGAIMGVLELIPAAISASAWMDALRVSGKTDWFLFGLFGYTPIALIFIAMFAASGLCIFVNIRGMIQQKNAVIPAGD